MGREPFHLGWVPDGGGVMATRMVLLEGGEHDGQIVFASTLEPCIIMFDTPRNLSLFENVAEFPVAVWDPRKHWYAMRAET